MMNHKLCKEFFEYWTSCCWGHNIPDISCFAAEKLEEFDGCGLICSYRDNDIYIDYVGHSSSHVIPRHMTGRLLTDIVVPALKPMQVSLLMPCFRQKIGLNRYSRCSFEHRHKDVEFLMLPVRHSGSDRISLVGVSVTFVDFDPKDTLSIKSTLTERIIRQSFISFGRTVDLSVIDAHTWAVLDTMGARVTVDGQVVDGPKQYGIIGAAGIKANELARPNVLAVASEADFGGIIRRLGGRYNLKLVETLAEARRILTTDMIDILVTMESYNDGSGLDLIQEAQKVSAFTACVLMLDADEKASDTRVETDNRFVQCLVKPVGDFALRRALDDAHTHIARHRDRTHAGKC